MSFNSSFFIQGSLPRYTNPCEPILNISLYFYNSLPSNKHLYPLLEQLVRYERIIGIPISKAYNHIWNFQIFPVPLKDIIRDIPVYCENEVELIHCVANCLNDPLTIEYGRSSTMPLWEIIKFQNYSLTHPVHVIVLRIHHAIGDGHSLSSLFMGLFFDEPLNQITYTGKCCFRSGSTKIKRFSQCIIRIPAFVLASSKIFTLPSTRHDNIFIMNPNRVNSHVRTCIHFPRLHLSLLRRIQKGTEYTINDILLTIISQVMYQYHFYQPFRLTNQIQCRAILPVVFSRSSKEKHHSLCNHFCVVSVDICANPISISKRLASIHQHMTFIKMSQLAQIQLWILNHVLPNLPLSWKQHFVYMIFQRHSLLISNIRGPSKRGNIGKCTIQKFHVFSNGLLPQITALSYNGYVQISIVLDHRLRGRMDEKKWLSKIVEEALTELVDTN